MNEVVMEKMTWPEIDEALKNGFTTAILVSASVEQHGPHLPLITDTAIGYELATRLAQKLGNALVAPVIRPGCSDHHMAFPGSFTLPKALFQELVKQHCRNLAHHGFQRIVLLSSHGGNFFPIQEVAQEIVDELAVLGVRVIPMAHLEDYMRTQRGVLRPLGRDNEGGPHAEVTETSQILVINPDWVRWDRIQKGFVGEIDPKDLFRDGMRKYTPTGIMGNPEGATPQLGEQIFEALSDYLVAAIRTAG